MVAQIKTITSVTEQGLQRITRAINRGVSSDDLTKEIDRVISAMQGSIGQTRDVLQGAIAAAGSDVIKQMLEHVQLPQITADVWRRIEGCMRALNKVETLILTGTFNQERLGTINQALEEIKKNEGYQCSQTLAQGPLKENVDLVFGPFDTNKSFAEQRRKRLADLMQLRLDIIRYHATQTQTESK